MIFRILWVVAALILVPMPGATQTDFDPLLLNIRMSPNALHPPADMIKQQWNLDGYRLGRLGPQAAHTILLATSLRSGVRNTVICPARAIDFDIQPSATNPINSGNTRVPASDSRCRP